MWAGGLRVPTYALATMGAQFRKDPDRSNGHTGNLGCPQSDLKLAGLLAGWKGHPCSQPRALFLESQVVPRSRVGSN